MCSLRVLLIRMPRLFSFILKLQKMSMNTSRSLSDQMSLPIVASFGSHGNLSLPTISESTPSSAAAASPPPLVPTGASSFSLPAHATSVLRAGERARAALLDEAGGAGSSPILPRKRLAAASSASSGNRAGDDDDDAACDETDQESQDQ